MASTHDTKPIVIDSDDPGFGHAMPMLITQGACILVFVVILYAIALQFA